MRTLLKLLACGVVIAMIIVKLLAREDGEDSYLAKLGASYPPDLIAEKPAGPTIQGTVHGVGVVSGAILCSNLRDASGLYHLYAHAWEEQTQDRLMRDQAEAIRGKAADTPDPRDYGCVLIPDGTSVRAETGGMIQRINVLMPDGTNLRGVTLPSMVNFPYVPPRRVPAPSPSEPNSTSSAPATEVKDDAQPDTTDGVNSPPTAPTPPRAPIQPK